MIVGSSEKCSTCPDSGRIRVRYLWYAVYGHQPGIGTERRHDAPWSVAKTEPSFADMLTALRRTI